MIVVYLVVFLPFGVSSEGFEARWTFLEVKFKSPIDSQNFEKFKKIRKVRGIPKYFKKFRKLKKSGQLKKFLVFLKI